MSNKRKAKPPPRHTALGPRVAQVSAADRAYFEQHPEARTYLRRVQPGEFGEGIVSPDELVTVEELAPGIRLRKVRL